MFEAGERVTFGFAHVKQFYVEYLHYLLEQWDFHNTQLMCESHMKSLMINSSYKEGVCIKLTAGWTGGGYWHSVVISLGQGEGY